MTFELESLTKVRVLDVRTLSSKDRKPGDPVGSQLLLRATMASSALAMFDGLLPSMLYGTPKKKAQGDLEGIDSAELTGIGDHVKRMPWEYEQTGCEVLIDFGMGRPEQHHARRLQGAPRLDRPAPGRQRRRAVDDRRARADDRHAREAHRPQEHRRPDDDDGAERAG